MVKEDPPKIVVSGVQLERPIASSGLKQADDDDDDGKTCGFYG